MADILDDTIAAGGESAELAVTPLAPLAFNSSAPCQVLAKNDADGGESWGLLYRCDAHDETRILYPTAALIKVVAGDGAAARVKIVDG
jgi:hypothetical protein